MEENIEWLEKTGYEQMDFDGSYYFKYRKGNYGAFNSFALTDVINAPLEYIKKVHKTFLEKAEKQEAF